MDKSNTYILSSIKISVILCTHNPKTNAMNRALEGLKSQTLNTDNWELIIVDNVSKFKFCDIFDVSWHPHSEIITENQLGLIYARIKGMEAAVGDLFVFVDDDNELYSDFLENALKISYEFPHIGAYGGNLIGDFEVNPPESVSKYLDMMAIREIKENRWSNLYQWETTPAGAGMVIRAEIARSYVENTRKNNVRLLFGRKGSVLMSSEDIDMAYTAIDMGYNCGLFKDLKLTHIIPKSRLTEKYVLNLCKYNNISSMLLDYVRFGRCPDKIQSSSVNKIKRKIKSIFYKEDFEYQMEMQRHAANSEFHRIIKKIN